MSAIKYECKDCGRLAVDINSPCSCGWFGYVPSTTQSKEQLRDDITSIIYGADWKDTDIKDAYKPDVEAAMELIHQHTEAAVQERTKQFKGIIDKLKIKDGERIHIVGLEALNFELSCLELESQKKNTSPNQLTDTAVGENTSSKGNEHEQGTEGSSKCYTPRVL